ATNGTRGAKTHPPATAVQPDLPARVAGLERTGPEPDRSLATGWYPAAVSAEPSAGVAGTELTQHSRRIVSTAGAGCFEDRPGSTRKTDASPQPVRSLHAA